MIIKDREYFEKLKNIPQFPLHIHWDGSIPAHEIWKLAQKKGMKLTLPEKDRLGKKIEYRSPDDMLIKDEDHLREFFMDLNRYHIVDVFSIPVSFMQTKDDLIFMAKAHCRYLKSQNVPYAETRFAPQYHTRQGLSVEQVVGYALEGFEAGLEETGVDVKLIISLGRESDSHVTEDIVRRILSFKEKLVGIDLATEERGNPPEKHKKAFELTFDTSLKRTVHAGEMCEEEENLKNIHTAITELRADALGHAIPLFKRYYKGFDLIEAMLERNIRLEANPVSNHYLFNYAITYHNLDELVDLGLLVTVNPDDPAMWPNGDQVHSLYFLGEVYGNSFIERVTKNAVISAWGLSDEQKASYLEKINDSLKILRE
ncbi:MAG: adenosine deaminase family protein [Candidatus Muiribacteriaceae bacterium]